MAHAATLVKLAEDLVTGTTGLGTDDKTFLRLRDRTIKGLRDQSHARTNQFATSASLNGLVEKFAILNREDLSDGLKSRLEELPTDSKWMPEILSLLLELSDRPAEKTQIEDVDNANKPPGLEHELTWDDIVAADPLDEPDIWDSVEHGYHSSGDENFDEEVESDQTISTSATSVDEQDSAAIARLRLVQPNAEILDNIRVTRDQWKPTVDDRPIKVSELVVVREVLSLLRGQPTDLFRTEEASGRLVVTRNILLSGVSRSSLSDVLETATTTCRALNSLRRWISRPQQAEFQRSMQSSVQILMSAFDKRLAAIEQSFVAPDADTVVSLLNVLTEAQASAPSLMRISLLTQLSSMSMGPSAPFALLDYLHDEVGTAQLAGDFTLATDLSFVLFAGLTTYLRFVSKWITTGASSRDEIFFVKDALPDCDRSQLWRTRYELRRQPDGTPIAPKSVLGLAELIFALGKSRLFLMQLDPTSEAGLPTREHEVQSPRFERVSKLLQHDSLVPFSHLISDCLEEWIQAISVDCTPMLRSTLLAKEGLPGTMDALPHVFFSEDGAVFQSFADSLLQRIDKTKQTDAWNDNFMLTELGQSTIGSSSQVKAEDVYVKVAALDRTTALISQTRKLELVSLGFAFDWPAQNITDCRTSESHARVFVLLLQLHYSATMIRVRFFDLRSDEAGHASILRLRKSLLWFIELMQNHITVTAHAIHQHFMSNFRQAADIDGMISAWAAYVKRLETALLLTSALQPVRNAITSMLELNEVLASTSASEQVGRLQYQFDSLLRFVTAGVRGVSRVGGEPALEALAERLEWGMRGSET